MAASEVPDAMSQTTETLLTNEVAHSVESWPPDLEIYIEYCTRSPFHARYDPDKYMEYFQAVSEAFRSRSAQTKIVGNPFTGRHKVLTAFDKVGTLSEDVDLPRLGAFEVSMNCTQLGSVTIFSKLETRHWPNPKVLVVQVDRLLKGEPLLQPRASPRDDGSSSPKKRTPRTPRQECWSAPKSGTSIASTPRSPRSPERTPVSPERQRTTNGAAERQRTVKKTSLGKDRKEAPVKQQEAAAQPPAEVPKGVAPGAPQPEAKDRPYTADDSYYAGEDDFEADESGDGSSCFGTKVWMPGAAKQENWEADDANRNRARSGGERVQEVERKEPEKAAPPVDDTAEAVWMAMQQPVDDNAETVDE